MFFNSLSATLLFRPLGTCIKTRIRLLRVIYTRVTTQTIAYFSYKTLFPIQLTNT